MPEGGFDSQQIEIRRQTAKELDLHIDKKELYHGSSISGIRHFDPAEETTISDGVYFTSDEKSSAGYAKRRAKNRDGTPVVYKAEIENLRLANLTTDENVRIIFDGFKPVLQKKMVEADEWFYQDILRKSIEDIDKGQVNAGNIRNVTFSTTKLFTNYLLSLGYDGLVAIEGGEGNEIGNHDSYVIFNPDKIKILSEVSVK